MGVGELASDVELEEECARGAKGHCREGPRRNWVRSQTTQRLAPHSTPAPWCTRTLTGARSQPLAQPKQDSKGHLFSSQLATTIRRRSEGEATLSALQPVSAVWFRSQGTYEEVMALQRTHSLLLLLVLTLLGLGMIKPSYGQNGMYQRFLRQHMDPDGTGGTDGYCNLMMQRRRMTLNRCKPVNTFIHENIWDTRSICYSPTIRCKNNNMNCHEGIVKVTDCRESGLSKAPNCRYRAIGRTRRVVIACEGYPKVPVHFDG